MWRLESNENNLSTKILKSKYGTKLTNRHYNISFACKGFQKLLPDYNSYTRKIIGNGHSVNFWFDTWLDTPLRMKIEGPLPLNEENRKIYDTTFMIDDNKYWTC